MVPLLCIVAVKALGASLPHIPLIFRITNLINTLIAHSP